MPDIFYPNQFAQAPTIPYKYIAEYFFQNRERLRNKYSNIDQLSSSEEINTYITYYDANIAGRELAEVKGWLAALVFEKDQYYESIAKEDKVITEAIKRMSDGTFDRLGIRY